MFSLRVTKTASKATAVQVVWYENRRVKIAAHLGSAHSPKELATLKEAGLKWIATHSNPDQLPLFSPAQFALSPRSFSLDQCQFLGVGYSFIYNCLSQLFEKFEYTQLKNKLLLNLVLIRIIEPASKLRSLELLKELFGITYAYRGVNRHLSGFSKRKNVVEDMILTIAKREFGFDFTLVFYDVTTLYFEAFGEDELRKPGFSKDGKGNQPQILIGLVVNQDGFPVAYEIFEGNTFEGQTMIPVIQAFQKRHAIQDLTVVADAGMISLSNVTKLKESQLTYIVGARLANLPIKTIQEISQQLGNRDGATIRLETKIGTLVCDFKETRYKKDKREMEKQLIRAKALVEKPGKMKRAKFVTPTKKGEKGFTLNELLIERAESLLGIKGYYTNLKDQDDQTIIQQYHNLWHVEHAFRIAKSDLETRPIYHHKKKTVEAHILICFMALAVCKYMELKTGQSTKRIIRALKSVTDAKIRNTLTGETTILQTPIPEEIKKIVDKLTK